MALNFVANPAMTKFVKAQLKNYATPASAAKFMAWENKQKAYGGATSQSGWSKANTPDRGFNAAKQFQLMSSGLWRGPTDNAPGANYTPQGAIQNIKFKMTRGTPYDRIPLGAKSQAYNDRFGSRMGVTRSGGWQNTLTQSTGSRSSQHPSMRFRQEVFQTQETRKSGAGTSQFLILQQHPNEPRLNKNLKNMYREAEKLQGHVRKSVGRYGLK